MNIGIIGGGPAGLAAALECLKLEHNVILFEKDSVVGGISKTIENNGYRFDIGGHRFFTKIKEVSELWHNTLKDDFMHRPRNSSIYYNGKFYTYPIEIKNVIKNSSLSELLAIGGYFTAAKIFPCRPEDSFEKWVINRFGKKLYTSFFKCYTEKVWGIPCSEISADWADQRIKGLSILSILKNMLNQDNNSVKTLISSFEYPKMGPGQMYEKMALDIEKMGGRVYRNATVMKLKTKADNVYKLMISIGENTEEFSIDACINSAPIDEIVSILGLEEELHETISKLSYRGLIVVNMVLDEKLNLADNWLYLHDPGVVAGRLQYPYRWSSYMVPEDQNHSLSLEYFASEGDSLWNRTDKELSEIAMRDLMRLGLTQKSFVRFNVIKVAKAYPVYSPGYRDDLNVIKERLSKIENLYNIGRGGQFRYNNMDHSILTGMYAARRVSGMNFNEWNVNTEKEYLEGEPNN